VGDNNGMAKKKAFVWRVLLSCILSQLGINRLGIKEGISESWGIIQRISISESRKP